jgi:putative DNA primase/helicase
MIEQAIAYGNAGLKVFPVRGKIPAVSGWKKLATSNSAQIREIFQNSHTGIGMATGQGSGVTVLDVDVKNGLDGFSTLRNHGIEIPSTVCVLTPTGGRQYYFKYNSLVKNKVSAICEKSGIDIRNDGGLVIMPKSVHPNGGIYEFQAEQGYGEIELAEIPDALLAFIIEKNSKDIKNFELPDKINDGERNNILFKYAAQLRSSGLDKKEILPALYVVNTERCHPPYEKDKLEIIADSACTYPKGRRAIPATEVVYSDTYNAGVFHEMYKDKIRWCRDLGGWFIYDGVRWDKDNNDNIKRYALLASDEISDRMRAVGRQATGNLKKIHTDQGINSMISCAKPLFGASSIDFDRDRSLFNCMNGTYDLSRNIFTEFRPEDLLTKRADVEYDTHAVAYRWKSFLDEIFLGEVELIEYIQRVIGYSMTAHTKEHCMFILYGHGRNGKNIFTEAISGVLGDYAMNCPSSMFVQKQNPGIPNDVARLKGARFVTASETNANITMDEELIKQLTGNKIITARFLNREFFDFEATFKIFLATNHKPNIRGTDTGIWSRIQMIPFRMTVTPETEDKNLAEKLAAEKSGIFNWMIEGYNQWTKMGIKAPNIIREATQIYRDEEDDIGQFINTECIEQKGAFIASQEFRDKFKQIMGYPKGTKALSEYMEKHGYRANDGNKIYVNGKQRRGFVGLRWANSADYSEDKGWSE